MRRGVFFSYMTGMALVMAFNGHADAIIDDCESKSQNKFGYYWFFFDDSKEGGNSTLPGVTKSGDYVVAMSTGGHTGNCLAMPYKLGPKAAQGGFNYVGCGTMLCAEGEVLDITGATAFTFWIKSDKATIVDFMVLTGDIKDYAYYHRTVATTTNWTQATVTISDMEQPGWAKTKVAFNPKCVTKLQWQMHTDNVGKDTSGTVYLDDIGIMGYTFIAPDQCPTCVGNPDQGTGALLSNMNAVPNRINARNYSWFCYNDAKNHNPPASSAADFSRIVAGATLDETDLLKDPSITIDTLAKKGYNGTPGAYLNFTLGPNFKQAGDTGATIKPFVGIGTLLSQNGTSTDAYNAQADGATGVYFDYMLSSSNSSTELRLEVYANNFLMGGVVHYIKLPATGATGEAIWKGATVPFVKLKLPAWEGVNQTEALDAKIMKKLQWAVQDAPGTQCELAIDNVYFTGATKISATNTIKFKSSPIRGGKNISASIQKNSLKVSLPASIENASVNLVDTKGAIAAAGSRFIEQSSFVNITIAGLAQGVYVLVIKEKMNCGVHTMTMPVTIY